MDPRKMLLVASILAVCAAAVFSQDGSPGAIPGPAMLEGLSAEEVMDRANEWGRGSAENKISVWTTSRRIHFIFADGTRTDIALPENRMVVSFAPYIMKTHPCRDHTPSSCLGEQTSIPLKVKAVTSGGEVLLDRDTSTLPNGFVDLWLPRNEEVDVTIEARGLTATERIGSADSDITCITTLKLHY